MTYEAQVAPPSDCATFRLRALVEGCEVEARSEGGVFVADSALLDRAQVLVALGETFSAPECARTVRAGLADSLQAALTFVRAADQILEFRMTLDDLSLEFST